MATPLAPVSFCEKPNIPVCNLLRGIEDLPRNRHGAHTVFTLSPIRLLGVDDPCVRWNLGILVVTKTGSAAWLLSRQWHDSCHFVSKFEDHCFNISEDILERWKIFQKRKHHSLLWKVFQIRSCYFLLHRHFKVTMHLQGCLACKRCSAFS